MQGLRPSHEQCNSDFVSARAGEQRTKNRLDLREKTKQRKKPDPCIGRIDGRLLLICSVLGSFANFTPSSARQLQKRKSFICSLHSATLSLNAMPVNKERGLGRGYPLLPFFLITSEPATDFRELLSWQQLFTEANYASASPESMPHL